MGQNNNKENKPDPPRQQTTTLRCWRSGRVAFHQLEGKYKWTIRQWLLSKFDCMLTIKRKPGASCELVINPKRGGSSLESQQVLWKYLVYLRSLSSPAITQDSQLALQKSECLAFMATEKNLTRRRLNLKNQKVNKKCLTICLLKQSKESPAVFKPGWVEFIFLLHVFSQLLLSVQPCTSTTIFIENHKFKKCVRNWMTSLLQVVEQVPV